MYVVDAGTIDDDVSSCPVKTSGSIQESAGGEESEPFDEMRKFLEVAAYYQMIRFVLPKRCILSNCLGAIFFIHKVHICSIVHRNVHSDYIKCKYTGL